MAYDTDDFETDVIKRSYEVPVLVDFWAEWCGPCKVLGPILERLAQQQDGEWELAKLDTERHQTIASQYAIRSIPNVKLFVDGQVSEEFVGALPEPQVIEWLRKAIPSKYRTQLEGARQLLLEDRGDQAQELLQTIVAAEPDNDQAIVLLAQAMMKSDAQLAVKTVERINLGSKHFEEAEAIRTLVNLIAWVDEPQSLPQAPVREVYLSAIRAVRSSDFEAALNGLFEVIGRDRYYDDDGSRKACIAIFKLLGEDHRLTRSNRPTFSAALY